MSEPDFRGRLESLLTRVRAEGLNAALVLGRANIFYFTGTDVGEALLVTEGCEAALLVPRLDYVRALDELKVGQVDVYARVESDVEVSEYEEVVRGDLVSAIGRLVRDRGVDPSRLGATMGRLDHSTYEKLLKALPGIKGIDEIVKGLRAVKGEDELRLIREAVRIAEEAMRRAVDSLEEGVTELEVVAEAERTIYGRGAVRAFDTIVAFGDHTAHPHAAPGARRLREGDLVKIDLGVRYGGYCSDITRTFVYGKPSSKQRGLLEVVLEAQKAAMESVRSGVRASDVDAAARARLGRDGLARYFVHGTGHGLGVEVHEHPSLAPGSKDELVSGMVVTVEPGVYIRGYGGIRIEDMVLVTHSGCEVLTGFAKMVSV